MSYSRRQLLGGISGGAVAGAAGWEGLEAVWNWATREPDAPTGNVNLGEIDEENIDWEAEVEAGEESVFYQLSVNGPETDRELIDTGMPSGGSDRTSGEFEPESPGTYRFALDAQTDTYDRTLDSAEMTVWGPLEPTDEEEEGNSNENSGEGDEGLDFEFFTEEDYLEQPLRSRNRFEARLDGAYEDVDLGELQVDVFGKDEDDEETIYTLDNEESDLDYGGLRLDGNFQEGDGNVVGFDPSFAEDLYELSRNNADEFTDFLEYAEERAD